MIKNKNVFVFQFESTANQLGHVNCANEAAKFEAQYLALVVYPLCDFSVV